MKVLKYSVLVRWFATPSKTAVGFAKTISLRVCLSHIAQCRYVRDRGLLGCDTLKMEAA